MKKLLILSGKGGTGKTTVASALIYLLKSKSYADCDVDAPNLHITVPPQGKPDKRDFYGLPKASINYTKCTQCGLCKDNCNFGAISLKEKIIMDPYACEGCGVCAYVCPVQAITMVEAVNGEVLVYNGSSNFATAKLKMGAGASGKLVTEVKKSMKDVGEEEISIIDGSPGIGCPVIASISGVDMVLIVTEPTVSGISDLQRILKTAKHFNVKHAVCINKYDINEENTERIKKFCQENQTEIAGLIPFDHKASVAINSRKSIAQIDCIAGRELQSILKNTLEIMNKSEKN